MSDPRRIAVGMLRRFFFGGGSFFFRARSDELPQREQEHTRSAGHARHGKGMAFGASQSMPSANAEAPCRSEGNQRRTSPRDLRRCPPDSI